MRQLPTSTLMTHSERSPPQPASAYANLCTACRSTGNALSVPAVAFHDARHCGRFAFWPAASQKGGDLGQPQRGRTRDSDVGVARGRSERCSSSSTAPCSRDGITVRSRSPVTFLAVDDGRRWSPADRFCARSYCHEDHRISPSRPVGSRRHRGPCERLRREGVLGEQGAAVSLTP